MYYLIEAGPHGRNGWVQQVTRQSLSYYTVTFLREEATMFPTEGEARIALISIPRHWDATIVQIQTYPGDG
jgi:hypothetical protein